MKKILAAILSIVVMAAALTGCNKTPSESDNSGSSNESSLSDSSSSESSSSSSSSSESSSSDSSSSESSSSDSSSSESSSSDSSSTESSSSNSSSNESKPSGGYNTANEYGLELPNSRAGEITAKALAAAGWGNIDMLDETAVNFVISDEIKFDMLEDYCFLYPAISVGKTILMVAKPKAGSEDAIKAIFDGRYDFYKNDPNAAFYLADQEHVAGTVSGVTNDGYYYVIVHKDGSAIQSAIA